MEEIKVEILEEYRGNINPDRKFHLVNIETGKEPVSNLTEQEIEHYVNLFHFTLIEREQEMER